jgi:hypothetical protein
MFVLLPHDESVVTIDCGDSELYWKQLAWSVMTRESAVEALALM